MGGILLCLKDGLADGPVLAHFGPTAAAGVWLKSRASVLVLIAVLLAIFMERKHLYFGEDCCRLGAFVGASFWMCVESGLAVSSIHLGPPWGFYDSFPYPSGSSFFYCSTTDPWPRYLL